MRTCRYTTFECTQPHLKCDACDVAREWNANLRHTLVPAGPSIRIPDIKPYIKFTDPLGRPGVEIGIKGKF